MPQWILGYAKAKETNLKTLVKYLCFVAIILVSVFFPTGFYGRVAIDVAESILGSSEDILDLVEPYYNEIRDRRSNRISGDINIAIRDLNYESVQENFNLINESYKVPVFVEFDELATHIWQQFVNLMDVANGRPSRTNFLQIKNAMEQYMIGVSEDDVNNAGLEQMSGIFKIDIDDVGRFCTTRPLDFILINIP